MRVLVFVCLVACGDTSPAHDAGIKVDARTYVPPCPCAQIPTGIPSCGSTCGNDQIDTCYVSSPMGCHCVQTLSEVCDGMTSCESQGFYGGTAACSSVCLSIDTAQCNICAPGALDCVRHDATVAPRTIAVSGSYVAVATSTAISIYPSVGANPTNVTVANVRDLVGVPGGWVGVTQPPGFFTLSTDGTLATKNVLPGGASEPTVAYGAGGRVVVAWIAFVNEWRVFAAILDATGTVVVPASELFPIGSYASVSAASDGASFFVGAHGQLARITPDGTKTVVTGYPTMTNELVTVTASGTAGWYVSSNATANTFVARRFDASGATASPTLTVNVGGIQTDFLASGADLLALKYSGSTFAIARVDANGSAVVSDVGARAPNPGPWGKLERFGTELLVAWHRGAACVWCAGNSLVFATLP